ncbi:TetR/AcrR family transcriptional regulator [Sorangium sp. So ce260]|uniref:TetR/AcrR family transcriptional regulator n=1 Tax=Sorangium sp. So ce260 TaxID=3133291 RepID=UPI003F630D93
MGRHREFDEDQALARALDLFQRRGYEGASLSELTEVMGISRPSLYAAFGDKEGLFRKALDLHEQRSMVYVEEALSAPTALEVVTRLLEQTAQRYACPSSPPACLGTTGALVCSPAAEAIRQELIARRTRREVVLRKRLEQAQESGDLPADASPEDLARYVMTVMQGMDVQAASGVKSEALRGVAEVVIRAWPVVARAQSKRKGKRAGSA